jgi:hypothetical protein
MKKERAKHSVAHYLTSLQWKRVTPKFSQTQQTLQSLKDSSLFNHHLKFAPWMHTQNWTIWFVANKVVWIKSRYIILYV